MARKRVPHPLKKARGRRRVAVGKTPRQLATHKGALQEVGKNWKGVPIHLASPPKTGTGMLGKQTVLTGLGPQTQRRRGTAPSLQFR